MMHDDIELSTLAVQSMGDDELHRAERDLTIVATTLSRIAATCMQRAKAARSVISKREHARSQGRDVQPAPPREARGGRDLVRLPGETVSFSDHAVLRWIERTGGIDIDAVRAEMAAAYDAGETMAGGGIVVSGGNCFVRTARGVVKTMMPLEWLRPEDIELAERTYRRSGETND